MKRRLEIARGLLHHPRVLFLDEPTIGLDPQTRRHIWDYLLRLREQEDLTIFLTTHYIDEAEHCDRIAIIDHGQIVALDTPDGLKRAVGGDLDHVHDAAIGRGRGRGAQARYGVEPQLATARSASTSAGRHVPARVRALVPASRSRRSACSRPTLDDVFLTLTGHEIRDAELDCQAAAWPARPGDGAR